jgi:preprotein translocase subunit SecG
MSTIYFLSMLLFVLLCISLCFVILIQESKSSGLGALGGGDSSESVFGTSAADVLKKFTGSLAIVFLVSCVLLSFWTSALGRSKAPPEPAMIENEV